jgi:hypothetical protein
LALEKLVLGFQAAMLDGLLDESANDVEMTLIEGLLEIPVGAGLQGFDRVLRAPVARDDNAGQIRGELVDLPHQFEPVDPGHLDVGQYEIEGLAGNRIEGFGAVTRHDDAVAGPDEDALESASIKFFVVNDEDRGFTQWKFLRVAEGG